MLRFHASWREEVGSILVVIGIGLVVFGALDLWLESYGVLNIATAWMCIFVSPLFVMPGVLLHLTRSRRRQDIEVPPPAPGQHQPPHRPTGPARR